MNSIVRDLGDCSNFASRVAILAKFTDGKGLVGTLYIVLTPRSAAPQVFEYEVREKDSDRFSTRKFELAKIGGSVAEVHTVYVGGMPSCSCRAGTKGMRNGRCKHRLSLESFHDGIPNL